MNAHSSESLMRLIADEVPAMIAYFEAGTLQCRFANARYAHFNGHTTRSILGMTVREAIGEAAWQEVQPHVLLAMQGLPAHYTRLQPRPQGQVAVIEVSITPHHEGGELRGAFVLIHDITHHWQAERAVRQSEERMRKFSAATDEAIVFHQDGRILDGNEALQRLTGFEVPEILGRSIFDFLVSEDRESALEYSRLQREDPYEVRIRHRDGRAIPVEVVGKTMPLHDTSYRVVIVRDLTARKQAQERMAFLSSHDPLTQLPNRKALMESLDQGLSAARRRQGRMAVLVVNLDRFKTVNDSLGHHAGDQLLREVAQRLRQRMPATAFVARLGGDEFAVVLPEVRDHADIPAVADQLLASLQTTFTIDQTPLLVTPSVGISIYPEDGLTGETLLRHADAAMFHAKDSGRGHWLFYTAHMAVGSIEVLHQERLLRESLTTGAFELHYQPQVRMADGRLTGMEALVRWRHPERGLVGPDDFIAFAEARGLIMPLGRWVLEQACRQLQAWRSQGLPCVPVAINLSALEFRQQDLHLHVQQQLERHGVPPHLLEIELTETTLMKPSTHVMDTLKALKDLGVQVAIDDFGTGYSSLSYLKRFPLNKLKIDRSFIRDLSQQEEDRSLTTAIIQMARSLRLKTVAEGVETAEQFQLLCQLGCDIAQGFYLARPLSAREAGERLTRSFHLPASQ